MDISQIKSLIIFSVASKNFSNLKISPHVFLKKKERNAPGNAVIKNCVSL